MTKNEVARLLFHPQMIVDGNILPAAFPMTELLAEGGKTVALSTVASSYRIEITIVPASRLSVKEKGYN